MRRVIFKGILAHKLRLLLTALSVVLGVGFVAGTFVLTDTLSHTFDTLFEEATGNTDAEIRSTTELEMTSPSGTERDLVPEDLLETVRGVDGVAEAEGYVQGDARIVDQDGEVIGGSGAPNFGGSAGGLGSLSPFTVKAGRPPDGPDEAMIDAATAGDHDLRVGDRVRILFPGESREFRIVGTVGFGSADNLAGATFALFDTATAQEVLDREGQFNSIGVAAEEGVSPAELVRRMQVALPEGYEAITSEQSAAEAAASIKEALGFFSTGLLIFAAVSLFVGAFIIFNTFSIIVAQRSRELALLRALGASRDQVTGAVLAEGLVVGVVASVVGVGFGIVVAVGLRAVVSAVGLDLPGGTLVVGPRAVVIPVIVGVFVTALSSWVPARRASKVPPVAAIRGAEALPPARSLRRRLVAGALVLAAGAGALAAGLFADGGLPLVGAGALFVYVGVAMLSPLVAAPLAHLIGAPAARFRGLPGRLARQNAMRDPRRTASTAAALMIGLGLVSFVTIFAASLRASFESAIERAVKADYLVQASGQTFGFSTEVADRLAAEPALGTVSRLRFGGAFRIDGDLRNGGAVDPATFGEVMDVDLVAGDLDDLRRGSMLVHDSVADDEGWNLGDRITVVFPRTGEQPMRIAGLYADDSLFSSGFIFSLADLEPNTVDNLDSLVLAVRAPGVSDGAARAAVAGALGGYPGIEVLNQAEYKEDLAAQIDQLLVLVFVLLALAIVIALFGIVNTLALSVFERTRELGLLRAVGMGRRQLRRMVRWESVIIAVLGATLGLGVGAFFGWAVVSAMDDEGIDELAFPAGRLVLFVVFAAFAGVVAAVFPARRAARLDVLEAISQE